jgi:molybdopterin-containing oxidoreductase family iron-sulfur binding subunit
MSSLNEPNKNGRTWWRSLDEVVAKDEFRTKVQDEFPEGASELLATGEDRRHFLKIMGASMALAGLGVGGCRRWPKENIVPYAHRPENTMPGIPEQYASCFDFGGVSQGVLVTSNDGRPTKIEGNPEHPDSRGKTDAFTQAAVLDLYDPDRSRKVTYDGTDSSLTAFKEWVGAYLPKNGKGIAVVSEPTSSPTFERMQRAFMKKNPQAMWVEYAPLANTNEREGLMNAFGGNWIPVHNFAEATVIVSLDQDFLGSGPMQVPNTRGWAQGRKVHNGKMSRVWIAEPGLSVTGAKADERSPMNPAAVTSIATYIAKEIAKVDIAIDGTVSLTAEQQIWADKLVSDLNHAGKHGLVLAGPSQPASVHYLVARINEELGALGTTISYRSLNNVGGVNATIEEFSKAMEEGSVQGVIVIGGNPAFDAPADLNMAASIKALPLSIHLSHNEDETSKVCKWHLNAAHWLESWSDGLAADGTICVGQPLIQPLFDGLTSPELLAILAGETVTDGQTLVRTTLFSASTDIWNPNWRAAVHDGVVANSSMLDKPPVNKRVPKGGTVVGGVGYTVCFIPSGTIWDGRHANNGWLQELPDSITKLTWDNAALISPKTAEDLGVKQGDMLKISVGSKHASIAVLPIPGTADDVIMLPLGYGRAFAGRVCTGAGVDVYPLRTSTAKWAAPAKVSATGNTYPLATTQMHFDVNSTPGKGTQERLPLLFREGSLATYNANPGFAKHVGHVSHSLSIFEEEQFVGAKYKWGMTFDLSTCTGCNACVAACHAENNIPIVGKDQVLMGREMHWIRIDRYFAFGSDGHGGYDGNDLTAVAIQPMTCSHCENAPCEEVCPVAATVHDSDGLNVMVYNRCIGTRYCSNNCPFKVRRFNYFDYFRRDPLRSTGLLQVQPDYYIKTQSGGKTLRAMQFNPEVTVRMRGVMEKCTYCTQRIQRVKIATKNAWVKKTEAQKQADQRVAILDGAIITACEQACPAGAIVFGDLMDTNSRVSKLHNEKRSYEMLEELNIKSRTKYLARLTNPIDGAVATEGGSH